MKNMQGIETAATGPKAGLPRMIWKLIKCMKLARSRRLSKQNIFHNGRLSRVTKFKRGICNHNTGII
ncbi:hypothetical protein LENED_008024 [Lentinula edodes]|uniref:Uncharacterized protein n=1 Tax=Lentinula edodes TaxID=5353 RepID=A0A1Q3EG16_LENED|nr:hypothetical protein LENED_008024 [Lentinula edodes]